MHSGKDQLMLKPRNTESSPPRLLLVTEKEVATASGSRVTDAAQHASLQEMPKDSHMTHDKAFLSKGFRLNHSLAIRESHWGDSGCVWVQVPLDRSGRWRAGMPIPWTSPKHRTVPTRENGQQHRAGKPSSRPDLQLIGNAQDGGTRATRRSWKHWNKQKVLLR